MFETKRRRSPLAQLTLLRTKELLREPEAVFWVFAFPILLAIALGFAFRDKGPEKVPVGVVEGPGAHRLSASLSASEALHPRVYARQSGFEALRTGRISLLIEEGPPLVFHLDPTRPDSRTARFEASDALERAAGRRDLVPVKESLVTGKGARYIDFLIPGLLGLNLMGTGMWGIGFSIVNARTRKLLKRLVATPMRRTDYLLAQILARLAFLVAEVAILVFFGWLLFDVGIRGPLWVFVAVNLMGAMSFAGLGLLVAARPETIEAVSGWMNVVMVPMWVFSGVFFSSERFPDAMQPFINALPLTALNQALRAVMNEGAGLLSVAPQMGNLAVWGTVSFLIALRIFKWR